jgi:hypothetical protein
LCPSDTFSGTIMAPSEASCQRCPQFSHSPAGSISMLNCTCDPGRYELALECAQCKVCNPGKSIYKFGRASCLPCSGQENHDKYAGQGAIPDYSCQGSDIKYAYDYVYTRNDLRLEWHANWTSLYPWAPRCFLSPRPRTSLDSCQHLASHAPLCIVMKFVLDPGILSSDY